MAEPSKADRIAANRLWDTLCRMQEQFRDDFQAAVRGERPAPHGYGNKAVRTIARALSRARRGPPPVTERAMPWLVVVTREQTPLVIVFTEEKDARAYFEQASLQWSESFLARALEAPLDWKGTP